MSVSEFFEFFIFQLFLKFFDFFYFSKILKKVTTCQADIVPRGSDSVTCHYYARCHFFIIKL